MAGHIQKDHTGLDVLINIAGVFRSSASPTADGYDIRFAVNYLAAYLLTQKLLPLLKAQPQSRIINLSSAAQAPVLLEALQGGRTLSEMEAYGQSKLALTMWSVYMARRESELVVIPVNPGSYLNTRMVGRGLGFTWLLLRKALIFCVLWRSPMHMFSLMDSILTMTWAPLARCILQAERIKRYER